MLFNLRRGLTVSIGAGPSGATPDPCEVGAVAVMADDYPTLTFDLRVKEGDEVAEGQTICVDRQRPEISFVAPAAGRVARVRLGARRRIEAIEISVEGDAARSFDVDPAFTDDAELRRLLLASGAWTAFRTRPFGLIPDPDCAPFAIFVTATDTHAAAANPTDVLAPDLTLFQFGIDALLRLTTGRVYLCQPPGPDLAEARPRLVTAQFAGRHPAGLAGTHIHHLAPASRTRVNWHIGYQDVVALGHLLQTGRILSTRVLSRSGAGFGSPGLVRAPLGARLSDLMPVTSGQVLLSGSILSGRARDFLGRHDFQVTRADPNRPIRRGIFDRLPIAPRGATLPLEAFEEAFPFDILPVPLMRALAVGDVETAERLGCLELIEEDLALLCALCPSGADYGALLRRVLTTLADEAPL